MSPTPEPAAAKSRRGSAATRAAILEAARLAFTEAGYEAVGLRDICGRAGVDAALANRYFGSKLALFAEVMEGALDIREHLTGERADFGYRLARAFITRRPLANSFRPMLVLIRSASNPEAAAILKRCIEEGVAKPLIAWLGGRDAEARAGLILAELTGFFVLRYVIGLEPLAGADEHVLIEQLAAGLQAHVEPDMR